MKSLIIALLCVSLGLVSCGEDRSKHNQAEEAKTTTPASTEAKAEVKTDTSTHAHTYVCPMHAEVTSDKADAKCPKCDMALEHKK